MGAIIRNKKPLLNKKTWLSSLDQSRKIYAANKLNNGVALVDTLEQLINCVDELSSQKASGVNVQEYLKKCYENLIEVSKNLDGALKVITYHSLDVIKDYLTKKGIFVGEEPKKSFFDNWIVKAGVVLGTIASIIVILQFLKLDSKALDLIKSLIFRIGIP
jgi:hypothetical protein